MQRKERRTLLAKAFFLFRDSKMKICRCVCDVVAFFFSPSLKEFARIWLVVVFLVVPASHSSGGSKGRFHHRLTGGCSSGRPCCDGLIGGRRQPTGMSCPRASSRIALRSQIDLDAVNPHTWPDGWMSLKWGRI